MILSSSDKPQAVKTSRKTSSAGDDPKAGVHRLGAQALNCFRSNDSGAIVVK